MRRFIVTVESLLTMSKMGITLMAAGAVGEPAFAYSGQPGGGFVVFTMS